MKKQVSIFGDSIARGMNDYEGGGWVNRLAHYLKEKGEYEVLNFAVGGDTSFNLLNILRENELVEDSSLIIVAIGINDSEQITSRDDYMIPVEEYVKNLEEIKNQALKYSNRLLFIGLTPVDESKMRPVVNGEVKCCNNESIKIYDKELEEFCKRSNLPYVPVYNLLDINEMTDGIHPGAEGHRKICTAIQNLSNTKNFFT